MTTETIPQTTPAETRERTAADVLRAAARYIEEHGWEHSGEYVAQGRVCVYGAINAVLTGDPESSAMPDLKWDAIGRFMDVIDDGPARWNDDPARTEAEVLQALRDAADTVR